MIALIGFSKSLVLFSPLFSLIIPLPMATFEQNQRASFLKIIPEQSAPSALFSNHSHCPNVSKFRAMADTNQNLFDKKKIIEKLS